MGSAGLIMFGLTTVLPQILGLFQKDDPKNPTLNVGQGMGMLMQNLMPFLMFSMMGKKEDGGPDSMVMMLMMMQMLGTGQAPILPTLPAPPNPEAIKQQIQSMQDSITAWNAMLGGDTK